MNRLLLAAVGVIVPLAACGQAYPSKPIRIIQASSAGAPSDVQIRAITPQLTQTFGQPFIIENRPGGDGVISAEACARTPADGYTLCLTTSAVIVALPLLQSRLPYDPDRDFSPISNMGVFSSAILVHPAVPAKNMQELLALARQQPKSVTWGTGSTSPITAENLYIEWFRAARDTQFLPVPYKFTSQALNAAVAGEVQVALFALGQATRLARSGQLRALAVVGERRSAQLPDVPSLKEQGIDMTIRSWIGLFGRAGMPEGIARRYNSEIRRIMEDADFREKYATALGLLYAPGSPEDFARFVAEERRAFQQLFDLVGLKKDAP